MKTETCILCNRCKKMIWEVSTVPREEYLHIEKEWGYFSGKDGMKQEFDLCEACYDAWLAEFQIPVVSREVTELV